MEKNEGYRPVIPNSFLTSLLVLAASLLNLSSRVTTSVSPSFFATPMASVLSTSPGFPRSISLPGDPPLDDVKVAITSCMVEWSPSIIGGLVHFHPGILQHLTGTGGVCVHTRKPKKRECIHLCPSFTLTSMSGCARNKGITGEQMLLMQAKCNKVFPFPSSPMFTLKPGSCLISSATFFASPFSTAACMITEETSPVSVERKRKEKK